MRELGGTAARCAGARLTAGLLVAPLLAAALASCASGPSAWEASWAAPLRTLAPELRPELAAARDGVREERWDDVLRTLEPLVLQSPRNLDVRALAQDARLGRAGGGATAVAEELARLAEMGAALSPGDGAWLRARALTRTDKGEARAALEAGLSVDDAHPDLHLALAALALEGAEMGRWGMARAHLDRALELDPGHLAARRLQAWMWAEEGSPVAGEALQRWLSATGSDPRVGHEARVEAALDLVTVRVRAGRVDEAVALLEALRGERHDRARRLDLEAVVQADLGDLDLAEALAWASASAQPEATLPWVQLALLAEARGGGGAEAWEQVAAVAGTGGDLAAAVQALRARVAATRRAREGADGYPNSEESP